MAARANPSCSLGLAVPLDERLRVLAQTRAWVERAVIGLNLCPFAKGPHAQGRVRYVFSGALDTAPLLADLATESEHLAGVAPECLETTLLVHPLVLADFSDYNAFLNEADALIEALGLAGTLQVASFHPQYCFAGTAPTDLGNATNRSPYPLLHLLREASVTRAVAAIPDPAAIYLANLATLERLGASGWSALEHQCAADAKAVLLDADGPR
jgi:hypothetical protein